MTQLKMIELLSARLEIPKAEVRRLLHSSAEMMKGVLDSDMGISLPGLGTFHTTVTPKRRGFNPRIHKFLLLPPKRKVKFHASSTLKDQFKYQR